MRLPPKMVERTMWAMWWLMIVGASFWLMVGSVSYWMHKGYLQQDSSGWVQAIGAIVAIGIAIVIPLFQRAHEQEISSQAEKVVVEVVLAAGRRGFEEYLKLDLAYKRTSRMVPGGLSNERLLQAAERALEIMQRFDVMKMPRPQMVQPFITVQRCLESLIRTRGMDFTRDTESAAEMYILARKAMDDLEAACVIGR